jgi:hypothetical protein
MRVTNEQARNHIHSCEELEKNGYNVTPYDKVIAEYAADLLEARVLIKEMQEVLVEADMNALGYKCSCDICTKARTLIDKTKGYDY